MNNQIKDLKLQTFKGKESEVALGCEKSRRSKSEGPSEGTALCECMYSV